MDAATAVPLPTTTWARSTTVGRSGSGEENTKMMPVLH